MSTLFDSLRFIRSLVKAYYNYKFKGLPGTINYDLTYNCNLTCEHCYFYKNYTKEDAEPLSPCEWEAVFRKHRAEGVREAVLTGGEPLLRQNIIELANTVFGMGHVNIVTNGTIPIRKEWKNLFFVSIDGDEETNDHIRGKGMTRRILKNINGDKRIIIAATITKSNYRNVDAIYQMAKSTGVRGLTFSFYTAKVGDTDRLEEHEQDTAIDAILRLRLRDPGFVLISRKILQVSKSKAHVPDCVLRGGLVHSYTPSMERKTPCVLGEGIDCSTCGCSIPVVAQALKTLDWETIQIVRQIYS